MNNKNQLIYGFYFLWGWNRKFIIRNIIAIVGYFTLDEKITLLQCLGAIIVIFGYVIALKKK